MKAAEHIDRNEARKVIDNAEAGGINYLDTAIPIMQEILNCSWGSFSKDDTKDKVMILCL